MKIKSLIYIILLGLTQLCYAQAPFIIKVGEKIPQIKPLPVFNSTEVIDLNKPNGKLIILDFFSIHCVPCVNAIPKIEALQEAFKDKLQIIVVAQDTKEMLSGFLKTSEIFRKTTLPVVTANSFLKQYFPYQTVPTHVWIDKDKVFRFITDGENATNENLEKFFQNETLQLSSVQTDFKDGVPIWRQGGSIPVENLTYSSIITKKIIGTRGIEGFEKDPTTKKAIGYRGVNILPTMMLVDAFNDKNMDFRNWNRVLLNLKDSSKFIYPKENRNQWAIEHQYCYEINVPIDKSENLRDMMKQDIERAFGLKGVIEKRKTKCLVLSLISDKMMKTAGGKKSVIFEKTDNYSGLNSTNIPFNQFFAISIGNSNYYSDYLVPVIDETHFTGNVDIKINGSIRDIENVKRELLKYDLQLKEEYRMLDILVITQL
ncbi:thiol-disulfide isomerase/thioredoxin [Mucilaginibacter gracilis]|uniref:Thiol-disulfide isomerase/thioredoxin n=1 Tax=Mucilaginibacter gracilis TaxID=423350 RepID=A0A495J5Y7_9SPHI|nr:redoxin domain-containing protein [Mucilaginibacter gracilis]RKR84416.1 thiol-disulfide isomerase/thioredoxin [Mucilaginibacter gracilis]